MNIRNAVRGAARRAGVVSLRQWLSTGLFARGLGGRRTMGAGSNLASLAYPGFPGTMLPGAGGRTKASAVNAALPKRSPANLRRFAETPVARRAINVIKDRIAGMKWRIQARSGRSMEQIPDGALRAQILTANFQAPNPDDSFRSFVEQVLEDVIVGGFGAVELDRVEGWKLRAPDAGRQIQAELRSPGQPVADGPMLPLLMWPVDGATIRIMSDWDGRPDSPRYVQVTGLYGANGQIVLNDDELSYIRLNPRTHTPFGLGRVEVAFETINEFLSAHRYAGRLASNSVVQYALWLQDLTPANHERLIRWWQDEIEGTGRVPIMSAETKPEVLRFAAGNDADLRLAWQEFLIRIIADAFDLPAQFLGVTSDVNRATAAEMTEMAFRSAIVPTARLIAEHLTRDAIGKKLGWTDLEFVFIDVDATDEMEQAQIDEILLRNGVLTVNEVRRNRGLSEII
jgi:phage portal protein BeeE